MIPDLNIFSVMIEKIFLDGCVLMDFFENRTGANYVESILALGERKEISCQTSSVLICTIAYLFEKYKIFPKKEISNVIASLMENVTILPVNKNHIQSAVEKKAIDFEDNVQTACAEEMSDCIITDNKKHFKNSMIPVYTPKEFLAKIFPTSNIT